MQARASSSRRTASYPSICEYQTKWPRTPLEHKKSSFTLTWRWRLMIHSRFCVAVVGSSAAVWSVVVTNHPCRHRILLYFFCVRPIASLRPQPSLLHPYGIWTHHANDRWPSAAPWLRATSSMSSTGTHDGTGSAPSVPSIGILLQHDEWTHPAHILADTRGWEASAYYSQINLTTKGFDKIETPGLPRSGISLSWHNKADLVIIHWLMNSIYLLFSCRPQIAGKKWGHLH